MTSFGSMPNPNRIAIGAAMATIGTACDVMSAG
jgi:hypothetical protein